MRNLEEYRAEVFRRSEVRIRARKRRRIAILTACVPVVLCIALVWAVGLPGTANETASGSIAECATEPAMGAMTMDSNSGLGLSVVRVEVKGMGFELTHAEPEKVAQIEKQLETWKGEANSAGGDNEQTQEESDTKYSGIDWPVDDVTIQLYGEGLTITLVTGGGERQQYSLVGNCLTDLETKQTRVLTRSQRQKLAELLEVTIKEEAP